MLFALAAIIVVFVAGNVVRQRAARREQDANDRAARDRRTRVRELRTREIPAPGAGEAGQAGAPARDP